MELLELFNFLLYFAGMKIILCFSLLLLFYFVSCKNEDNKPESENDIDAARNFIQAALYGKFDEARKYMLPDSVNDERMRLIERLNLSPDERKGLASASIIIHERKIVNDSTSVVIYSNSFMNDWDTLKAVKISGQWLIDFKYLFDHAMDTLMNQSAQRPDSIH